MAITVRNETTLNQLEKLTKALGTKTLTGVIDQVVMEHLDLLKNLKEARKKIEVLNDELSEIKSIVRRNAQAVKAFSEMCDKINTD